MSSLLPSGSVCWKMLLYYAIGKVPLPSCTDLVSYILIEQLPFLLSVPKHSESPRFQNLVVASPILKECLENDYDREGEIPKRTRQCMQTDGL